MKIDVNQSNYSIGAWERAKFCAARKGGTVFGHFVKQVLGAIINSQNYQKTRKGIEKYAKIEGFAIEKGKLRFSAELYQNAKRIKHQQKLEKQSIDSEMVPYRNKAKEFQSKLSPINLQLTLIRQITRQSEATSNLS